jgi:hypothetical protein
MNHNPATRCDPPRHNALAHVELRCLVAGHDSVLGASKPLDTSFWI